MQLRGWLVILGVSLTLIEGKIKSYKDKRPNSNKKSVSSEESSNEEFDVCDLQKKSNLNLYCECNDYEDHKATEADCLLFNKGVPIDAPVWSGFRHQTDLTKLTFNVRAEGTVFHIPTEAISYLRKLKVIEIIYASIPAVEAFAFGNLTLLQDLELGRNEIVSLNQFSFAYLPELKVITLGENKIKEIRRNVFVDLPSLRKLYIDKNEITHIEDEAFAHLNNLEELDLSKNFLTTITRDTFFGLRSLKRLELKSNNITRLEEETFSEMPILEEIILQNNKLRDVSPRALWGLSSLLRIDLNENHLIGLPENLLRPTPLVSHLDLRKNELRVITAATIQPLIANFLNYTSYLYIEENNLICDCRLRWIYKLANETQSEILRSRMDALICYMEDEREAEIALNIFAPQNITRGIPQRLFSISEENLPCSQEIRATASANVEWSSATGDAPSLFIPPPGSYIILGLFSLLLT